MSEPTRLNITNDSFGKKGKFIVPLTLEKLIFWIKKQDLDDYTTKSLVQLASTYPSGSLESFRKNFLLMLQRVRAKKDPQNEEQNPSQDFTK